MMCRGEAKTNEIYFALFGKTWRHREHPVHVHTSIHDIHFSILSSYHFIEYIMIFSISSSEITSEIMCARHLLCTCLLHLIMSVHNIYPVTCYPVTLVHVSHTCIIHVLDWLFIKNRIVLPQQSFPFQMCALCISAAPYIYSCNLLLFVVRHSKQLYQGGHTCTCSSCSHPIKYITHTNLAICL